MNNGKGTVLNDLCRILSCHVEDVLLYIPDEAEES